MEGLGFWSPTFDVAFTFPIPFPAPNNAIFFYESLIVLYAIRWVASHGYNHSRLAIHSDNNNTVHMFNTLSATPHYSRLLRLAVDELIIHDIDLRVYHISGVDNKIADLLSRNAPGAALALRPSMKIDSFTPPAHWLGVLQK
ncbi:hypothetical protein SISNIDRAFT_413099 [Sistotremastrum niveocremeum HHB9708]|uniref:RNase H type-1 domain-containing protein n=1 Tax=Sistotremastrum niveocremeum HHB9708 TaxID=1314777 RepID=A0A164TA30_9AGAM|nr:hypothetical protein SISNIDRAFT_413099 [Sistotremastrum niveocremeum HHB9708]